jgi:hypothetical protein
MAAPAKPRPAFYKDPEFLRRQQLLLLLAAGCLLVLLVAPLATLLAPGGTAVGLSTQGFTHLSTPEPPLYPGIVGGLLIVCAAYTLYAVYNYRNRKAQVGTVRTVLIATFATQVFVVVGLYAWVKPAFEPYDLHLGWGMFLLPVPVLLQVLALQGIRADIKRVRSAERFW